MRRVGRDDERPIEKDTLGLPASDLVQVPIPVCIPRIPFESHTTREFIWESLHELYILLSIDFVNVHDVEYINVLNVEEGPPYRPSARQSRSARWRLLVIAASAGNFL